MHVTRFSKIGDQNWRKTTQYTSKQSLRERRTENMTSRVFPVIGNQALSFLMNTHGGFDHETALRKHDMWSKAKWRC